MLLGRSVLSEVGRNFLTALVSTTGMAFFVISITFLRRTPGVGMGLLVEVFPLFFPLALQFTVPLAMLTGTILTFGRMAGDGELTAMAAAGISLQMVFRPALAFAALVSLASLLLSDVAAPFAARQLRAASKDILHHLHTSMRAGLRDLDFGRGHISFEGIEQDRFTDICLEYRKPDGTPVLLRAESGHIEVTEDYWIILRLHRVRAVKPYGTKHGQLHYSFGEADYALPISRFFEERVSKRRRTDLVGWELAHVGGRGPEAEHAKIRPARALEELARRTALAAAAFFFALIGIPLGISSARGGRVGAFLTASAPVLVLYFPLVMAMSNLARKGEVPVYPGLWSGNLLLTVVGGWLLWRMSRQ